MLAVALLARGSAGAAAPANSQAGDAPRKDRWALELSHREYAMIVRNTQRYAALIAWSFLGATAQAAETPKDVPESGLDGQIGQSADLSPWAYAWRADRQVQERPEAYFIPRRLDRLDKVYRPVVETPEFRGKDPKRQNLVAMLPAPKGRLLSALLWLAPVQPRRIELRWPEGAAVPPAAAIEVRVYPAKAGWFGFVRDEALPEPDVSPDGRTWTYSNERKDPASGKSRLTIEPTDMVAVFFDASRAKTGDGVACPAIRLFLPHAWQALDLEIEWGLRGGAEKAIFDGRIEAYCGYLKSVKPLPEDKGTTMAGSDSWRSAPAGGARRGIAVSLLYPGRLSRGHFCSPVDARITLWTQGGNLTFLPDEVHKGPIWIPEHGVFAAKAGGGKTARQFAAELASKNPKSLLQVVRRHAEPGSCEDALRQVKLPGGKEGTAIPPVRPFEEPPETAMRVQVPDERWNDAWRRASWQLKIHKGGWQGLSFEAAPILRAADLVGLHETSAKRFDYWLKAPGVKPDGDFVDGDGSFEYGAAMKHDIGWSHDGTHTGTFLLLFAMSDRYLLTGDKVWFEKNRARIQAAADWLIRQRRRYMRDVPNRDRLEVSGLLPPMVLGDTYLGKCLWLWYICTDAMSVQALDRWADALEALDPPAAKPYRDEAEAYRRDLVRAAEREMALSPVRPVRDGTYRTYVPMSPYRRGAMQREGFGVYAEADYGLGALPLFNGIGVLAADDPRLDGHLEILEEAHLNRGLTASRKQKGLAEADDVYWNGIAGLAKPSLMAQIHFRRDDVPCFLRFWTNNYAAFVQSNGGFTEGSSLGGYQSHDDKPHGDLGTTAWFMENFRNLLVWEDGRSLWLARATPRAWLEQGKRISVKNAPTHFGSVAYEIVSDADHGKISATVEMPSRAPAPDGTGGRAGKAPKEVVLRFRHPKSAPMKGVTVKGKPWAEFDKDKETIILKGLTGTVAVTAQY
jgi:hypothetical protein